MNKPKTKLKASKDRVIYDLPLNVITFNPGNPDGLRDQDIIGDLVSQGFSVFPQKGKQSVWEILNGKLNATPDQESRNEMLTLLEQFGTTELQLFQQTIESVGIIHPIQIVVEKGQFGIESGLVRALAKSIHYAKLGKPPGFIECEVAEGREIRQSQLRALVENLHIIPQRNYMLFAMRLKLMRDNGWTINDIAKLAGVSDQTVHNYLEITDMPADVKEAIAQGEVSLTQAREMVRIARTSGEELEDIVDKHSPTRNSFAPPAKKHKALSWQKIFLLYTQEADEHTKEVLLKVLQIDQDEADKLIALELASEIDLNDFKEAS